MSIGECLTLKHVLANSKLQALVKAQQPCKSRNGPPSRKKPFGVSPFFFTFFAVNMSRRIQEMLKSWDRKLTTDGHNGAKRHSQPLPPPFPLAN